MHQIHISTIVVPSVMLRPKQNLEIRIVMTVKTPPTPKQDAVKDSQIRRRIQLCIGEIILPFDLPNSDQCHLVKKYCLRLRVCCVITSKVKKCCLKYKNPGVSWGFYISNNISTPRRLLYNKIANKYIILILQSIYTKLIFILFRASKMYRFHAHPSFFDHL
jgi:hypothetical protein